MKKILIIYAKTGGGHLSLARSVEESLNLNFPGQFEIQLCDPFPKIYATGYKRAGADFQELLGISYRTTDSPSAALTVHKINQLLVSKKLKKAIKQFNPDLIVSTYALATQEVSQALKKLGEEAKVVVLFADPFTPHAVWFSFKEGDLYLSPTEEVSHLALEAGIPAQKIKTIGWPVRQKFLEVLPEIKALRRILGLKENKFTIFLGGSGQGGGRVFELAKLAALSPVIQENCQIIIVTGMNSQLMSKLMRLAENYPNLFHLYPYNNNMPSLMGASDIIVGKAGPNLLFESIFLEKPFLATGCLPGQEEGNLDFIRRENIGYVLENPKEAVSSLEKLCKTGNLDPQSLEKLKNIKNIKQKNLNANQKAAQEIYNLTASK